MARDDVFSRLEPNLSVYQLVAVLDALKLACKGELHGCACVAESKPMPCKHVLEAADDPMLPLVLEEETRSGRSGLHTLRAAVEAVEGDLTTYPDFAPSFRPTEITQAEPGSREKKMQLRLRVQRGESVGRPGDILHQQRRLARGTR